MTPPSAKTQPKVEKVVVGEVIVRKKPWGRRFLDTIFGGDPHGVAGFVMLEIIVPAIKEVFVEAISGGVEQAIYGERKSPSRRSGYRPASSSNYVQYNRYSPTPSPRREEPREPRYARVQHDAPEIVFQTRAEAQEVLTRMFDLINEYEQVTLSDLYSMVDITGNYTDESRGWTDIRGTTIMKVRGGYVLDLPPTESLKN